ncbi:MAG TPA: ArgE/DapE family deacylase [Ignavibacteria bacterium]
MKEKISKLLCDLIAIPSIRGMEGAVNRYLYDYLKDKCDEIELITVDDSIMFDPDYSFPIENFTYKNTPNLKIKIKGEGEGKSVVFNTHVDVVPPSQGQEDAFKPKIVDDVIFGRGACDAKGQVATLVGLIELLKERKIKLKGDLEFHFVFEEESGGNGTLAMVRKGCKANAAIVLEPSEFAVIPSVRGAVWFDILVYGKSGHSGRAGDTVSAIKKAYEVIQILEIYHDRLLAESRGKNRLFDVYENPMPVTFGILNSGNWPATTPPIAELKGVFGFLPNKNRKEIMEEMKNEIIEKGSDWLKNNFEIKFNMLHSDGNVIPEDHPLVTLLVESVKKFNYSGNISAMTASCDAWLYNNQLKIPTVVFGPGSLKYAHSAQEQIKISEIIDASKILLDFVTNYCR